MEDELARVSERIRQNRTMRPPGVSADSSGRGGLSRTTQAPFRTGDHVFDALTGHEGDVVRATVFPGALLGTVSVRLDDGTVVMRRVVDVVLRPMAPRAGG